MNGADYYSEEGTYGLPDITPAKSTDVGRSSTELVPVPVECRWSAEGEPENLQAATSDSLEWLDKLHTRLVASGRRTDSDKLAASMRALAEYGCTLTRDEYWQFELLPEPDPAA